jgi:hypothetical protein
MGRSRSRGSEAFLYGLIGIVALIIVIGQFLLEHIWIVIIAVFPLIIFLVVKFVKYSPLGLNKKNKTRKIRGVKSFNLVDYHLQNARIAEKQGDFYNARKEYKTCVNISKKYETRKRHEDIVNEYENFVKHDPIFGKLVSVFTAGIQNNPGIRVIDITLGERTKDWNKRYNYEDAIKPEDISYFFGFAEKFGYIKIDKNTGQLLIPVNENEPDEHTTRLDNAYHHIEQARKAEQNKDYLGARVSYMKCIESLKHADVPDELEKAKKEYADFVRREPFFNKLLPFFLEGVKQNPGILQADITKKFEDMDWVELRNSERPFSKDDIRYVLYFSEEFGYLIRQKTGRSYRLYLPEQLKDVTEKKDDADCNNLSAITTRKG